MWIDVTQQECLVDEICGGLDVAVVVLAYESIMLPPNEESSAVMSKLAFMKDASPSSSLL
jgi:hypothetical protein